MLFADRTSRDGVLVLIRRHPAARRDKSEVVPSDPECPVVEVLVQVLFDVSTVIRG